jgi:hypothetical protein
LSSAPGRFDRANHDRKQLVRFSLKFSYAISFREIERDKQFNPILRFVALFFDDAEFRDEFGPGPSTFRGAIIGANSRAGTQQLPADYLCGRVILRQRFNQTHTAKSELKRPLLQFRVPISAFRVHMNPRARSFCIALRS